MGDARSGSGERRTGVMPPYPEQAQMSDRGGRWGTTLGQCDQPATCEEWAFALFCIQCAQASAKSKVDGTNVCYNFCCWHHGGSMSYVRRDYQITGTCGDDMMCALMCPCCLVRRGLTEATLRGPVENPFVRPGERPQHEWTTTLFACSCCEFFEAILCPWCVAHYTRNLIQTHERGDCCFDMLCLVPFAMYGQVRQVYGIKAEFDCAEDVFLPLVCFPCALAQARREATAQQHRIQHDAQHRESNRPFSWC